MKNCAKCGGSAFKDYAIGCQHVEELNPPPTPMTSKIYLPSKNEEVWQCELFFGVEQIIVYHPVLATAVELVKQRWRELRNHAEVAHVVEEKLDFIQWRLLVGSDDPADRTKVARRLNALGFSPLDYSKWPSRQKAIVLALGEPITQLYKKWRDSYKVNERVTHRAMIYIGKNPGDIVGMTGVEMASLLSRAGLFPEAF